MSDREIFQINLNSLLDSSGKSQRELADFVGVKKNTVSGWVHGVSYPRADAMERIALFFSVKLSRLVEEQSEFVMNPQLFAGNEELTSDERSTKPMTSEARIISGGIDKLPKEQREQALKVLQAVFAQYADYFKKGDDDE